MTSRCSVSLAKYFRAVVCESGSYMICGGAACVVPGATHCEDGPLSLPKDHPPILFLHGLIGEFAFALPKCFDCVYSHENLQDPVVPYWTMELYKHALDLQGTITGLVTCDTCDHQWVFDSSFSFFRSFPCNLSCLCRRFRAPPSMFSPGFSSILIGSTKGMENVRIKNSLGLVGVFLKEKKKERKKTKL